MSYKELLAKESVYEHKVCGMAPSLASTLRDAHKQKQDEVLQRAVEAFKQLISAKTMNKVSSGIIIGSAGMDYLRASGLEEDVVVYLLLDVIDIDSKMVTFVKHSLGVPAINQAYGMLYKVNPL